MIVVVVTVVVTIVVAMAPAFAFCFFEFLAALVGLLTVFAVMLDGASQFFLGLMDAPFALFVVIGACRYR
ncbi:MAG TPA: hypothetical protein VF845_02890 [Terriglobales bacterium]